jgi:hypothetical protein
MYCTRCGNQMAEEAQFCPRCGTPAAGRTASPGTAHPPFVERATVLARKYGFSPIYVAIAAFVVLIIVGFFAWVVSRPLPKRGEMPGVAAQLAPQPVTEAIVHKSITIKPREFVAYDFPLPPGSTQPRVEGHFQAAGGSGKDVEVFLFDEDGFANWKNGHNAHPLYKSGKTTAQTLDQPLPAQPSAVYYLVFSNKFSVFATKTVIADADLMYMRGGSKANETVGQVR